MPEKELQPRFNLSADGLIRIIQQEFTKIDDPREDYEIPLKDALMSAYAAFALKYPSLLQFEKDKVKNKNLKSIFGINIIPSDTRMREIVDLIETKCFRKIFKILFAQLQRGKVLESYRVLGDYYIISGDGTGFFSSEHIHCECCLVKNKKSRTLYQHMMYGACIVHPNKKEVFPLMIEPISNRDGKTKNDCERNAAKRFIEDFRREHPHLKAIFTEDSLFSNAPHIELLKEKNISFIIGAKEKDHKYLFEQFDSLQKSGGTTVMTVEEDEFSHYFCFANNLVLNNSSDMRVNILEYKEVDKKGKLTTYCWVTDIEITRENVYEIMKIGRARWKIENETFNTLKNQSYHFEHNFGHGKKNLSNNFATLMMLAFFVDQIQQASCALFRKALGMFHARIVFWNKIKSLFEIFEFESMAMVYKALAYGYKANINVFVNRNTS